MNVFRYGVGFKIEERLEGPEIRALIEQGSAALIRNLLEMVARTRGLDSIEAQKIYDTFKVKLTMVLEFPEESAVHSMEYKDALFPRGD